MSYDELERVEDAARHRALRVRIAACVIVVCVWTDCVMFGGWWGLALGWGPAVFLAAVTVLILTLESADGA